MYKSLSLVLFTLLVGSILSCKSTKEIKNFTEQDLRFSLSKGVCFGSCPVYELKIYHGGYATLQGEQNIDKLGLFERTLPKDVYKKLVKTFKELEFDTYPNTFPSRIPDLPTIKIGYHNGKAFKIVSGKEDRPEELMQAQFLMEKIVDSKKWTLVKSLKEINKAKKAAPSYIYNEIIIEPKKGLLLTKWLESQSAYGVRLVKKIAPAMNYYLIEFDTAKIPPKKFLSMLHADKDIKSAEFNKQGTQRGK